ncbi:MAG TPA: (d)CMP kinase [Nocardioidaceae bacterium]
MSGTTTIERLVIAMDGTAGSGKSSASRGVAQALGLRYLDTGAMYRAMTWQMLLDGVDVYDADAVAARADTTAIDAGTDPVVPTITLHGTDVSREIRSGEVNVAVSPVSAVPHVRELLVAQQRRIIGSGGIVVEGRDIGTVVAPEAPVKVFLSAHPAARAQRRAAELTGSHRHDVDAVEQALVRRDAYDSSRATAPLTVADDAVQIDTTDLRLDEVVARIVALVRERVDTDAAGMVR